MSITLAATAALLFGVGTWLLLQRRLSRIIIGLGLVSHGANLLLIVSGRGGLPAFGPGASADPDQYVDPLPQAMLLTAIVISFGVTAFLLAMAWRSFVLTKDDLVEDDIEDRRLQREADAAPDEEVADTELSEALLLSAEAGTNPESYTDAVLRPPSDHSGHDTPPSDSELPPSDTDTPPSGGGDERA